MSGGFDCFGMKRESFMAVNSKNESFSEILVRYGNKYQIDQSMQSNSLFGAVNAVEVARPAIPDAEPWSDLEKLEQGEGADRHLPLSSPARQVPHRPAIRLQIPA